MPPPTGTQTPQINQLRAAIGKIEELLVVQAEANTGIDKLEKQVNVLYHDSQVIHAELVASKRRTSYLESLMKVETLHMVDSLQDAAGEAAIVSEDPNAETMPAPAQGELRETPNAVGMGSGDRVIVSSETREQLERAERSQEAGKSQPIKNCVNKILSHLMGTKLDKANLPHFSTNLDQTDDTWPKDVGSKKPLMRFDWSRKNAEVNIQNVDTVIAHVRAQGAMFEPASAAFLEVITDIDLRNRIENKIGRMRMEYNSHLRYQEALRLKNKRDATEQLETGDAAGPSRTASQGVTQEGDEHQEGAEEVPTELRLSERRAVRDARANFSLEQRRRKRVGTEWEQPKYDGAFTLAAMSDHEDDPTVEPGQAARYIKRAPDYRSELVQKIFDELDQVADPMIWASSLRAARSMAGRYKSVELT